MFHWGILVAFTNAKTEEETYVKFPKSFPRDLFPDFKGCTIAQLKYKQGEKHLLAAKNVLRYLKGTINLGIRYTRDLARLHERDQQLNVLYVVRQ